MDQEFWRIVWIASLSGGSVALVGYLLLRHAPYNAFDPFVVTNVSVPLSAALLAVLCHGLIIDWSKYVQFLIVTAGFAVGIALMCTRLRMDELRQAIKTLVGKFAANEINAFILTALAVTGIVCLLGIQADAGGDARQGFARSIRPLILLQNGLFLCSLILLLSEKVSTMRAIVWLTLFIALSIPFSGKSIVFPLLYWTGLKLFLSGTRITLTMAVGMLLTVFSGVALMGAFAYRSAGFADMVFLFFNRLWMSGDTYIYAYETNSLDMLRGNYPVTFFGYMFHPLTSLVGIRGYDKPLGSMLASEFLGKDVITGPNPHLPVVLEFFFPDNPIANFLVALVIGALVIGLRPLAVRVANIRAKHLSLGIMTAAIFCPSTGFLDTSQVLISSVGITLAALLGTLSFVLLPRRSHEVALGRA